MDASSRQERLQMRQRGAGTRQINAVDFGISFNPTPRRSARNTPQHSSHRRQSRTPLVVRDAPNPTVTTNPLDQNSVEASADPWLDVYDGPHERPSTRSRKRRRLSSEQDSAQLITPGSTSQASAPSLSRKRSTSGRESLALPMQISEVPEQTQLESHVEPIEPTAASSPRVDKENLVTGTQDKDTPQLGLSRTTPTTERSTIRNGRRRPSGSSSRHSDNISILSATGDVDLEDEGLVAIIDESEGESLGDDQEGVSLLTMQGDLPDSTMELVAVLDDTTLNRDETDNSNLIDPSLLAEGQAETSAIRSANIKKKRSSLKSPGQLSAGRRVSYDMLELSSDNSSQHAQAEVTTPHQVHSTSHGHPSSDNSFYQANHDDEDETYLQPTSPAIPTPKSVAKKPPRKKKVATKARGTSASPSTQTRRKNDKRATFPVLTHRLTNTCALATITEEAGSEEETSETEPGSLQTFTKFHNRATPNCVDVLAQFCREDIEAAMENIGTTGLIGATTEAASTSSRASLKRKRAAIQAFSSELEARLFDLSTAVEHRLSLEARLKHSAREKAEMQARWVELRRERERVAIQIDEARAKKEDREREAAGAKELSELLFRTELEFERGKAEAEEDGLEWKLRTVAEAVSGNVGAGLLDRVREFNGVLERVVEVLDHRRSSG